MQLLVVTLAQLLACHIYGALMVWHHHRDEVGIECSPSEA